MWKTTAVAMLVVAKTPCNLGASQPSPFLLLLHHPYHNSPTACIPLHQWIYQTGPEEYFTLSHTSSGIPKDLIRNFVESMRNPAESVRNSEESVRNLEESVRNLEDSRCPHTAKILNPFSSHCL
jgi:hypothetical protein